MKPSKKPKRDLYVGTWCGMDEFSTNVEYTIKKAKAGYAITAIDTYDDERADILETSWDSKKAIFSFAAYWNSTGRFMRCKMQLVTEQKMNFTYTYTDTDTLVRKKTK